MVFQLKLNVIGFSNKNSASTVNPFQPNVTFHIGTNDAQNWAEQGLTSKIFHKHLQEKIALRIKLTQSRRIFPSWRFNSLIPKVDHIVLSQQQKRSCVTFLMQHIVAWIKFGTNFSYYKLIIAWRQRKHYIDWLIVTLDYKKTRLGETK